MTTEYRIGVDVGGTFTDLVAFDEKSGQTFLVKLPSTPHDPSKGAIDTIRELLADHPGHITQIIHASTVGTNLFLGQLGLNLPKGALVTTKGFRDVLEIGRQKRAELYNPFFQRPKPLIERHMRFGIDERTNFKGEILKPVDEAQVRELGTQIRQEGSETVAVAFLHAYANPSHEKQVCNILARELPGIVIVASHQVDPAYREYERISTTVVNSLLIPVVSRYLENLREQLLMLGIESPLYIMQSNGGLATVEMASQLPVATIESGPATGVTATAHWSKLLDINKVLSFDMGGTTAKAGVVIDGIPQTVSECEVGGIVHSGRSVKGSGYPVRFPFIDLAEVSGGGGTIAWLDQASALMVGPTSAGADPGPACYGKGGQNPTVTDANLLLGRLSPKGLSGGAMEIYPNLAKAAIKKKIADPLGMSTEQAASGIIEIVNNHMMRALRLVSIERGHDPRDFSMLAFGGAGPMHAAFLSEGMGIKNIFIPPNSGVFSALGLMLADFRHDFVRSIMKEISKLDTQMIEIVFKDMEQEALDALAHEGFASNQIILEKALALRYLGQSYELNVPLIGNLEQIVQLFHQRHQEIYGYASAKEPTEVVSAHLVARGLTQKPEFKKASLANPDPPAEALIDTREVHFPKTGWVKTPILSRDTLLPGNHIKGPAIIEQYDATNVIPPAWNAKVDAFFNLRLKRG
ncbi:hydantoinase/oxoprolinase family protein [Chloroflexota bacterium]